jgi:hypothetical protein
MTDIDGDPRLGTPDLGADECHWFSIYLPVVVRKQRTARPDGSARPDRSEENRIT